jgi:hypothetical protein
LAGKVARPIEVDGTTQVTDLPVSLADIIHRCIYTVLFHNDGFWFHHEL